MNKSLQSNIRRYTIKPSLFLEPCWAETCNLRLYRRSKGRIEGWGLGKRGKDLAEILGLISDIYAQKKGSKKGRWCHGMHLLSMDSIPWKSRVAHAIYGARCLCRINVMPFLRFPCIFVIDSDGEDQNCLRVLYSFVWVPRPLSQTSHRGRAELDSVRKLKN